MVMFDLITLNKSRMKLTQERPTVPDFPAFLLFFARTRSDADAIRVMTESEYKLSRSYEPMMHRESYEEYKENTLGLIEYVSTCSLVADRVAALRTNFNEICEATENREDFAGWLA